jgi:ribose/xylose/arabinose/galactoside ABC-type transport system permease subunit
LPRLRSECLSMTVPAILVIVAFIVVFLALNRFEFGRFD